MSKKKKKLKASPAKAAFSVQEIKELVAIFKEAGVGEFELRMKGMEIRIAMPSPDRDPEYIQIEADPRPSGFIPGFLREQIQRSMASEASHGHSGGQSLISPPDTPQAPPPAPPKEPEKEYLVIKSPMVGTFYRAPSPDAPNYVESGTKVNEESVLCIVEAMKLMNEIKAEVRGTIREVLVESGQPVQYGQPLFHVEPA